MIEQRASSGIDVPTLFFSASGIAAVAVLPFLQVRPNRIAEGAGRLLAEVSPGAAVCVAALWALAGAGAVLVRSGLARARLSTAASIAVPAIALVTAGLETARIAGGDPVMRVSLAAGFWITALLGYASFLSSSARAGLGAGVLRPALALTVPLLLAALLATGFLDAVSVMKEWAVQKTVFFSETVTHLVISGEALFIGCLLGIPIGIASLRRRGVRRVAFFVLNIVQTIPSLALFGLLILPLAALSRDFPLLRQWGISGIGRAPALIALSFYAMLPIARNTYTALSQIPAEPRDAGRGMGMTRGQLLARVEVPLALPVIAAGVRTAAVQTVGNTVVTALIGAGGLGVFIFQGLGQFAPDMILLGTLPVIVMALATDMIMGAIVTLLTPRPLRAGSGRQLPASGAAP